MGLREQEFAITYDTSEASKDPVTSFLEPCLENSVTYDRLSGYFSSRFLALAAKGLGPFLLGEGKMRLVMSSQLSSVDLEALTKNQDSPGMWAHLFDHLEFGDESFQSVVEKRHFEAMCWLVSKGRLEIRIVIYAEQSGQGHSPIFHPKIGIFRDSSGDEISFSGSINETASGWTGNVEEFKVFKSWDRTSEFVTQDKKTFLRHWNGDVEGSFRTIALPEALRQKLISIAPTERPNISSSSSNRAKVAKVVRLRDYQKSAIEAWDRQGRVGILEMATGTGKTKTAKGCIDLVTGFGTPEYRSKKSLVVVTAPFEHIAKQWMEELSEYAPVLASSSNDWQSDMRQSINRIRLKRLNALVVVAVQKTAAGRKFTSLIEEIQSEFDHRLFVGDEAHGLGATSFQTALLPAYEFRLGLSATPTRYYDELGTQLLLDFFGSTAFTFDTKTAMVWRDSSTGQKALSPYKYFPEFVALSAFEAEKYQELSESIRKMQTNNLDLAQKKVLESLLFKRAAVVKKAASKLPALRSLLEPMKLTLSFALIYCHDLEQLSAVGATLNSLGISYQKVTGEESNNPSAAYSGLSQRDWILRQFAAGTTRVLLAIRCLDEGVDVPAAKIGFILASSGNPREFVQRRGRLLRPSPGKEFAVLHDFVVAPDLDSIEATGIARDVFRKELERIREFAGESLNLDQVELKVANLISKMGD